MTSGELGSTVGYPKRRTRHTNLRGNSSKSVDEVPHSLSYGDLAVVKVFEIVVSHVQPSRVEEETKNS